MKPQDCDVGFSHALGHLWDRDRYDESLERPAFGLDDSDAAVLAGTEEIDVAVADGSSHRHLAQWRAFQIQQLPVTSQPLLASRTGPGSTRVAKSSRS